MLTVTITRQKSDNPTPMAILGQLVIEGKTHPPIFTLERLDAAFKPLIPANTYTCIAHGWDPGSMAHIDHVWEITQVPGHTGILLHAGNTVADSKGCILCGMGLGDGGKQGPMITRSQDCLTIMRQILGPVAFTLTIADAA